MNFVIIVIRNINKILCSDIYGKVTSFANYKIKYRNILLLLLFYYTHLQFGIIFGNTPIDHFFFLLFKKNI